MSSGRLALTAPFLLALLLLAGCTQTTFTRPTNAQATEEAAAEPEATEVAETAIPEPQEDPAPGKLYEWNGTGRSISHVVIDTNEQRARFYDGQEQVGWTTIASGKSSHPTPRGEFEVIEKVAKKRSNLYGRIYDANGKLHKRNAHSGKDKVPAGGKFVGASMPHFMRMTYDGIGLHAGAIPNPGRPASHGCIRLPKDVASKLFAHVGLGTRVTVLGNGPDYGNYAERVRQQREQERISRLAAAEAEAERSATASLASATDIARPPPAPRSTSSAAAQSKPRASRPRAQAASGATAVSSGSRAVEEAAPQTVTSTAGATAVSDTSKTPNERSGGVSGGPSASPATRGPTPIAERSIAVPVAPQYQAPSAAVYPAPYPPPYRAPAAAGRGVGVVPPMAAYPPAHPQANVGSPYSAARGAERAGTGSPAPASAPETKQAPSTAPDAARSSNEGSTSAADQDTTTSSQPDDDQAAGV